MTPIPSFRELKQQVSIERLLLSRGIRLRRRGERLVGPCPIHHGDNPTAFSVSRSRNLWHCFTACRRGGDVVELVRSLDGVDYRQAAVLLAQLANVPDRLPEQLPADLRKHTRPFQPFRRRLRLDHNALLLKRKQITAPIAARYEAGAYNGRGMLEGCVAVRLHDLDGRPLGYAGRRVDDRAARFGKWVFPPALPKGELLYGYHHTVMTSVFGLVVVECPWSVMRLAAIGIPAVALLGTHASETQLQVLAKLHRVGLLLDGDTAGQRAAHSLTQRLKPLVSVRAHRLPQGVDPDDLDPDALLNAASPLLF